MKAWLSSARTHTGKIRRVNEDAYLSLNSQGFWAVADGMGGHAAGDYASHLITTSLSQPTYKDKSLEEIATLLDDKLSELNTTMIDYAKEHEASAVGSTFAAVALNQNKIGLAHWVGDSCIFQYRQSKLHKLSHDHSLVQELVDIGELDEAEADNYPSKNIITRAVGASKTLYPEVRLFDYKANDIFLLCTDGLTNEVSEQKIAARFKMWFKQQASTENLQEALNVLADCLLDAALEQTASDNISFVVVYIPS